MNDRLTSDSSEYQPFSRLPNSRRRRRRPMAGTGQPPAPAPPSVPVQEQPPALNPSVTRRRTRRRTLPRLNGAFLPLIGVVSIVFIALVAFEVYFGDRASPGVRVLGEDIAGMTRAQADARLRAKFGNPNELLARFGGEQLILRDGENVYRAWPWELGFRSDLQPALDAAFAVGHRTEWGLSLVEQARALVLGADVSASAAFDEKVARDYVSLLAAQIDRPPRDVSYALEGLTLVETPAQQGRRLDGAETYTLIRNYITSDTPHHSDIVLPVEELEAHSVDAAQAQKQVTNFLAAPLMLTYGDRSWAIDQAALATLLALQPVANADGSLKLQVVLNREALLAQVNSLAREINQAARDARFHFRDEKLVPIVTSQEGRTLDVNATVKAIQDKFREASATLRTVGNASPARSSIEALRANTIALSVRVSKPDIDMRDMDKFGIQELVSSGSSNFRGSIPGRIQNIKTAQASFDGVMIPPGGTFSFVKYLSEIVEANGYEDAYVIFGDRTVLGPGGGVCQVSTTMFRAAFFAGFPIVERWPHAYRVGYYEPPKGLDAAVFVPSADVKFVNDSPGYILIEPVFDLKNTILTFNFYGTKLKREVKMTEPVVTNQVPHPPTKYIDDPTLPKGTTKQVDFAVDGEDVTLYREIYQDGKLIAKTKFFSHYDPWQAVYLRGTR